MATLTHITQLIDHAVLHPTATDDDVRAGAELSKRFDIAAFCVHSKAVRTADAVLTGSQVALAAVVGFPHGNVSTVIKRTEAEVAIQGGATEIDMVIDIGAARQGAWDRVRDDIGALNRAVTEKGALLKVIFETAYFNDSQIIELCGISGDIGVGYVKTSTGFGGAGATCAHVALMKAHTPAGMGIKASGGIRTLSDLSAMVAAGATRIGTSSTESILAEARAIE